VIFKGLFVKKPSSAAALYAAIVAAARQPKFYADWGVPDTVDGRFDMIVLHLYLVLQRLKVEAPELSQTLSETFFSDMDRSLREMGVGDLSVGKKVRKMAEAFSGRLKAYAAAAEQGELNLVESLQRNVYAGENSPHAVDLAQWLNQAAANLAAQNTTEIMEAKLNLP
jgi:cytochrome b pre-mRNA-processing protein 3